MSEVCVWVGDELATYGFPKGHPFGPERMHVFWAASCEAGLDQRVCARAPVLAQRHEIECFHTPEYVQRVIRQSRTGTGYLDYGDTPAFPGVYEAAARVVGTALDAARAILRGECRRGFIPIGGLHHARRERAGGFCVFNDCGVVIEELRTAHGVRRIAYVDIDAHHGDGVYYAFEADPALTFVDLHEDGRFLYPGTGHDYEVGRGVALGTKLNIPMAPGDGDDAFHRAWPRVESFLRAAAPEFVLLQCGADSVAGDPLTHLRYSPNVHAYVATRLCALAEEYCAGRLLVFGGGGYNHANLARTWTAVVQALCDAPTGQHR
jgi:acetoin utilization protein AcuC